MAFEFLSRFEQQGRPGVLRLENTRTCGTRTRTCGTRTRTCGTRTRIPLTIGIRALRRLRILVLLTNQVELCLIKMLSLLWEACPNLPCEADTPGAVVVSEGLKRSEQTL